MMHEDESDGLSQSNNPDQLKNYESSFEINGHTFEISDSNDDNEVKTNYSFTLFEIFVTSVVMLNTLSGGFLEGYPSAAFPSLIQRSHQPFHDFHDKNSSDLIYKRSVNESDTITSTMKAIVFLQSNATKNTTDDLSAKYPSTVAPDESTVTPGDSTVTSIDSTNIPDDSIVTSGGPTVTPGDSAVTLSDSRITLDDSTIATVDSTVTLGDSKDTPADFTTQPTVILDENSDSSTLQSNQIDSSTEKMTENSTEITEHSTSSQSTTLSSSIPPNNFQNSSIQKNDTNDSDDDMNKDMKPSKLLISKEEGSWFGSILLLGAAVGSFGSVWVVKRGRRFAILASAGPRLLGWVLVIVAQNSVMLNVGRFLAGVSVGAISSAAPIYISEVAHPSLRGSLSCIVILGVNIGMFVAAISSTFLEWRGLAVLGALTVVVYFIPTLCIPKSPSWLLLEGRQNDAQMSLRRLRRKGYSVEAEIRQISQTLDSESSISWKDLFSERRTLMPLGVTLLVTCVNRFSGYNAIITFCSLFIRRVVPAVSELWASAAVYFGQIVATGVAMMLVDSLGRRKLLLGSVSVMGLSLVSIAILEGVVPGHTGGTWLGVLATMCYIGAYSMGIGPLTWVLLGELFPLDARDKASALVSFVNWMSAFFVTKTYFSLESAVGIGWTCMIYASVCLVGVAAAFAIVPETKGRSLSEIEALFAYSSGRSRWMNEARTHEHSGTSSIIERDGGDSYSTFHY